MSDSSIVTKRSVAQKVRWPLVLMILAFVALGLVIERSYDSPLIKPKLTDERLVWVGSKTMLLKPEQLGSEMTKWFKADHERTLAFELSDFTFLPGSREPSQLGTTRITQIVQLMKAHPRVMTRILIPANGPSPTALQLDQQRAEQLRKAAVGLGVDASRVSVAGKDENSPVVHSSQLVVILSK